MNQKVDSSSTHKGKVIGQPRWCITRSYLPDCLTLFLLVAFFLCACTAQENEPAPSPTFDITPTAVTFATLTTTPSPTAHPQATPTLSPLPTTSSKPTSTAGPTITSRPTRTPRPATATATFVPTLVWAEGVEVVQDIDTQTIQWSPTTNEFVFDSCLDSDFNLNPEGALILMSAPNFAPLDLTMPNLICTVVTGASWLADGQRIAFTSRLQEEVAGSDDVTELWLVDRDGRNIHPVDPGEANARWLQVIGWMDSHTVVYTGYAGGGHVHVNVLDIDSGEAIAWGLVHGLFYEPSPDYVPAYDGMDYWFGVSAAVVSTEATEHQLELEGGPFIRWLSWRVTEDGGMERPFNSHFVDWLPTTNQMLVLTWPSTADFTALPFAENASAFQLQLWQVDTNELTPLVPGGIHGYFAPDGRTLSFITAGPPILDSTGKPLAAPEVEQDTFYVNLLDRATGRVFLSLPSATDIDGYSTPHDFDTFSPDGAYFTFLTAGPLQTGTDGRPTVVLPNPDPAETTTWLNIVDVRTGQLLQSTVAQAMIPVWSPNNDRFLYRNENGNLVLLFLDGRPDFPLTQSGGQRLVQPRWSFDGQYLSVGYFTEGCGCRTAVMRAP
jgi:Tol biopolymer transport system component